MEVERLNMGENTPEIHEQGGVARAVAAAEQAPLQSEQDVAAELAHRRSAVERAARSPREMKSPRLQRIEAALSKGLAEEYAALPENKKESFRQEGERLALWLEGALAGGTLKHHEVLTRMEHWLLTLEGRNCSEHWLLQEAFVRTRSMLREIVSSEFGH